MPKLTYPDILKKSNWAKHQGIVVKALKKDSGIGAACEKAEGDYNKIKWENLSGKQALTCKTAEQYKTFMTKLHSEFTTTVVPARNSLDSLNTLAKKVATEFAASSVIPKETREYVQKMATSAGQFSVQVEQSAEKDVAEGEKAEAKMEELAATQAALIAGGITKVLSDSKIKTSFATFTSGKPIGHTFDAYNALLAGVPKGDKAYAYYTTYLKAGAPKYAPIASGTLAPFTAAGNNYADAEKGLDEMKWDAPKTEITKMTNENIIGSSGRQTFTKMLTAKFGAKAPDMIKQFNKITTYAALKGNATLLKLYRENEPGKFIVENFDFIDRVASTPKGSAGIEVYEKFLKEGAADQVNIPASMRIPFDNAYKNYKGQATLFDGLAWAEVQKELKTSLDGFVTRAFAVEYWKFI